MDYKKLFDMTGRVCIVTGGYGYLGAASCKALMDFGATVVAAIRNADDRWASDEKEGKEHKATAYVECNVDDVESVKACFKTVFEKYGRIDVLVNCASHGAGFGKESQLEFMSDEVFDIGIQGGINQFFRCTREVIPYMKEKGGSIINYCSMYGIVAPDLRIYGDNPQKQPANYGCTKGAILQFTRYAASALAEYGIRVNAVTPGPFPQPKNQTDPAFNAQLAHKTMMGRFGQDYEMGGAIVLLASDASSFMTGTNITVDGGWTAW